MSERPIISHFGICASDDERSVRFYTEALDFEIDRVIESGEPFGTVSELPGQRIRSSFLKRGGVVIEILTFYTPEVFGPTERRPMNQLGLTHMGVIVDDVDATADKIVKYGGRVYPQTRVSTQKGDLMFCTDPDGVRIELWGKPE